ncbi:exported hypothetical protein [Erythrobacter sp. EC-HK427]|nr:exported hypothetical protein [Erythrobacter sp. EC-HK427]
MAMSATIFACAMFVTVAISPHSTQLQTIKQATS